ncbi:hypothetical protein [Pseudomonas brassicacearum]|uniref:hypothetical protein n=1 Tax=Pseudomonas brassicacearum TaxID=930166 RepID=UPI00071F9C88|nr:hypothetical protein [Pseudomonas brassicacearum]ALQ06490.1 hypothetical protein AK973_6041 [Pseudomonas brassicacearum]AOS40480.1 hypothetical protein A0U95_17365 [Pseudomonas brassicacearum]
MIEPGLGIRIPPKIAAEAFAHKKGLKLVPLADAWKIRQCSFAPGVSSFQFWLKNLSTITWQTSTIAYSPPEQHETIREARMSEYHDREVLNAGTMGTYRVHSLFTKITCDGDLDPEYDDPFPGAVALHAHEYTHYLHNLSTVAGLQSMQACFLLMVPFINYTDEHGFFTAPENHELDDTVSLAFKMMNDARGSIEGRPREKGFAWPTITEWVFSELQSEQVDVSYSNEQFGSLQAYYSRVEAKTQSGDSIEFTLRPGLDFISEGVAYEVEREQRRLAGGAEHQLDAETPSFPYLAYRPFIEFLIGRNTTPEERVLIGNLCLLIGAPSTALWHICNAIRRDDARGDNSHLEFKHVENYILNEFKKQSSGTEQLHTVLLHQITEGSRELSRGAELYARLINKALKLRADFPSIELVFIKEKLTGEEFKKTVANMLEHLVLQEKAGQEATLEWIGVPGSIVSLTDAEFEKLTVLQTSIHYLQQHFTTSGLANSAELRETACPFYGACSIEKEYGNPSNCKSKPWLVSITPDRSKICWYEAGRLSLRLDPSVPRIGNA